MDCFANIVGLLVIIVHTINCPTNPYTLVLLPIVTVNAVTVRLIARQHCQILAFIQIWCLFRVIDRQRHPTSLVRCDGSTRRQDEVTLWHQIQHWCKPCAVLERRHSTSNTACDSPCIVLTKPRRKLGRYECSESTPPTHHSFFAHQQNPSKTNLARRISDQGTQRIQLLMP